MIRQNDVICRHKGINEKCSIKTKVTRVTNCWPLLQMESLPHQALQARFVNDVVGEFFVGEHGEGSTLVSGHQF